jgi:hypothetical protein
MFFGGFDMHFKVWATPGLYHLSVLAHCQTDLRIVTRLHTVQCREVEGGVLTFRTPVDECFGQRSCNLVHLPGGDFPVSTFNTSEGSTEPRLHTIFRTLFSRDRKLHLDRDL